MKTITIATTLLYTTTSMTTTPSTTTDSTDKIHANGNDDGIVIKVVTVCGFHTGISQMGRSQRKDSSII